MKLVFKDKLPPPNKKMQEALDYLKGEMTRDKMCKEDPNNPDVSERRYCSP